jgi:hypothetical protein
MERMSLDGLSNGPSNGPLRADFGSEFSPDGRIRQLERKSCRMRSPHENRSGRPSMTPAGTGFA